VFFFIKVAGGSQTLGIGLSLFYAPFIKVGSVYLNPAGISGTGNTFGAF